MMMTTTRSFLSASFACLLALVSSCPNHSAFRGFDAPDTERVSRYKGERLLSALEDNASSRLFYGGMSCAQRERIISSLDDIIAAGKSGGSGFSAAMVARAALCAVDVLVHTDSLVHAVIYDLANPIIVAVTEPGASASVVFSSYTRPLKKKGADNPEAALDVIASCFYDLCRITGYYDIAALASRYGSYSGGDLQKYLVAGLVSGVVTGTAEAVRSSGESIRSISNHVAQAYLHVAGDADSEVQTMLPDIFSRIKGELGAAGADIASAYKTQILDRARILEEIALYAGFQTVARTAAVVLRRWGSDG